MRTRSEVVTFGHSFVLRGIDEPIAAGRYVVETDEEPLPTVLHAAHRRTTTWLTLPSREGTGTTELVAIDPAELAAALARDSQKAPAQASASLDKPDHEGDTLVEASRR
jgi:hypothetical protein